MTKDAETLERAHALFDPSLRATSSARTSTSARCSAAEGLRVRGKVFAFVGHLGGLVVKLPEARVTELAEQGAAERMVMSGAPDARVDHRRTSRPARDGGTTSSERRSRTSTRSRRSRLNAGDGILRGIMGG